MRPTVVANGTIRVDCGSAPLYVNTDSLWCCDFSKVYYEFQC